MDNECTYEKGYFCNAYPYIDRQMAQYTAKTAEEKG